MTNAKYSHQVPVELAKPLLNSVKCHCYADAKDFPLNFLILCCKELPDIASQIK